MPEYRHQKLWPHPRYRSGGEHHESRPSAPSYTELQVTTNFSFLRGASHPEEFVAQAAVLGYQAIGISDWNSLAGIVRAHTAAKQHGVQLLIGARVTLYQNFNSFESPHFSVLLYPSSRTSYAQLCRLLTRGKLRAPKGECYLLVSDLLEHCKELHTVLIASSTNSLEAAARSLLEGIPLEFLSCSISHCYEPKGERALQEALGLKHSLRVPLLATNDVHYHAPERCYLQDVLSCIRLGCTIEELGLQRFPNGERYLKPPQEMVRLFRAHPEALQRSVEIAEAASQFSLDELQYVYPREICPSGEDPMERLQALTFEGGRKRFPQGIPSAVLKQLEHEFTLIRELNYPQYFLTVHDIVSFARKQGILCQGRGAAANSAVCYCLGITAVDPSRISILFERFVSKERNEPPDIDIDFEHERREEVIQYIYQKYGRLRAALVCEVITYRSKSAIRDVGKACGLSLECVEELSKAFSRWRTKHLDIEQLEELGLDGRNPMIHNTLHLAETIRGFPRHLSQHVGGFIISDGPLCELVPIENARMQDRTVIEWDKDDIETLGMLKIDVLALGMLTCVRKAMDLIRHSRAGAGEKDEQLELYNIPAENSDVYDMICKADTVGVFQIESRAQMSMLPRLRPRTFYDLVIEVAIVRPGPIQGDMVHPYLKRRNGKEKPWYPDKRIEAVLSRTLGVPLFQEQAMELSIVAAGFTPGEADGLRRAMASWKRNKNALKQFRDRIVQGMMQNGYTKDFAEHTFRQIRGFGEYGFPESHAASFALLVYVSAWLKRHHPAAFAAALINSQPMGFYRPAQIVQDAKDHGVKVLPVDVNKSHWDCTLENGGQALRLGFRLVRSLRQADGEGVANAVQENGTYRSLSKLWRDSGVPVRALKALAEADAYESLGLTRQSALWQIRKFRDEPLPLFENTETEITTAALPQIPLKEIVTQDYHATGLSLKAHPVSFLRRQLTSRGVMRNQSTYDEKQSRSGQRCRVSGMVLIRQQPLTASGIIFMTLEDETGISNLIIRPRVFERYRREVCESVFLLAEGQLQRQEGVTHVIADGFESLDLVFREYQSASRDFC